MKQTSKQEAFRAAVDYTYRIWGTGAVPLDKAAKVAAKLYKVNAKELVEYVFGCAKNKSTGAKE